MSDTAISKEMNVAQTLNENPLGSYQKLILVLMALVFVMDGVASTALPVSIPSMMIDWELARDPFKFVMGIGLFGVAVGAALVGSLADRIGRRKTLIGCIALFGTSMVLASFFVTNITELAILKALDGLGIGGAIPAGMALLSESMSNRRRSLAIAISMGGIPIGGFIAGGIASLVLADYGWQMLFLIGGLLSLLVAGMFLLILPESPCFLALRSDKWDQLRKLMGRYGYPCDSDTVFTDAPPRKQNFHIGDLFSDEFRHGTILIWVAFFFCFIGSYSMFSWGPVMMISQGLSPKNMGLCIAILNFSGIIGSTISGLLVNRVGSRGAAITYCIGGIIGATFAALSFQYWAQTLIFPMTSIAFFGFFIAGILNMTYTMGAHMYPPFIKGTGLGAGASVGRIGAVASAFTGVAALNMGAAVGFFAMIAVCILITLASLLLIRSQIARFH